MNNFSDLCNLRYSVRSYKPETPAKEDWDYVMECVRLAPSAVNFQPWKFRYLDNAADIARLAECYNREWFKTIPACFIAYKDTDAAWVRKLDGKSHADIDIAIAVEHLCLAAAERGLGTCWVCNFDAAKCVELFPVSENLVPAVLIPIGYAADEVKPKNRKALEDILL